ncbi:MAG: 3-dehydroquinate synthase [Bradymonadia bacterium]
MSSNKHIYEQRFDVSYNYPVAFTEDLFNPGNPLLCEILKRAGTKRHRVLTCIDSGVFAAWPHLPKMVQDFAHAHPTLMECIGEPVIITGGEASKNNPHLLAQLHRKVADEGIDRHSFIIAIGGGAVLDLVGFAAATAHRGVRLIRVPTTVLAQNDAGVGVKNGINAYGSKNFLGSFCPPFAVLNDHRFLSTLERRDGIAGLAEAVKVALIRDRLFFDWMMEKRTDLNAFEPKATARCIRRCAELHLRHIAAGGDPFEGGSARPLDFGHWAAHKLEVLSHHALRHGEAVAIGIALDSRYSFEIGSISESEFKAIIRLLDGLGLPTHHPLLGATNSRGELLILEGLEEFRQHLGGQLTVTLLTALGEGCEVNEMQPSVIRSSVDFLLHEHLAA